MQNSKNYHEENMMHEFYGYEFYSNFSCPKAEMTTE